ncbi:MAG: DUF896 domain-containing protein [Firmicutes bacterium]|nr:DUF896 domain-containing protein [Bacillota bacterium]
MLKHEIDRINELARKSKKEALNDAELAEQAALRRKFLDEFRANFIQQLESIEIVEPDDPRLKYRKKGS